jgi:hypothetical protein
MTDAVKFKIDIEGHEETMWAYVLEGEREYDLILGRPWMDKHGVTMAPAKKSIYIYSSLVCVRSKEGRKLELVPQPVSLELYQALRTRSKKESRIKVFAASMANIQKALWKKVHANP